MTTLANSLFEEVYVVAPDSNASASGYVKVFKSFEDLLAHLKSKNPGLTSDLRVVHGVLTPAEVIPSDMRERLAFLVIEDPTKPGDGILLDADVDNDYKELAERIEEVLENEDVADFYFEVEDIFIMYGYELNLVLSVNEDELEEKTIEVCKEIAADAALLLNKMED